MTGTGIRGFHKLISSFSKSTCSRLKLKHIYYKHCPDKNYNFVTGAFSIVVNKPAPLKKLVFRGNDAPVEYRV